MDGLSIFFRWEPILFGMAVFSIILVLRRIVEGSYEPIKGNHWWKVFLSVAPALVGVLLSLTSIMPIPKDMQRYETLYGLVIGMFSGVIYRIVKATIRSKWPNAFKDQS
jgi:hypothetical protein